MSESKMTKKGEGSQGRKTTTVQMISEGSRTGSAIFLDISQSSKGSGTTTDASLALFIKKGETCQGQGPSSSKDEKCSACGANKKCKSQKCPQCTDDIGMRALNGLPPSSTKCHKCDSMSPDTGGKCLKCSSSSLINYTCQNCGVISDFPNGKCLKCDSSLAPSELTKCSNCGAKKDFSLEGPGEGICPNCNGPGRSLKPLCPNCGALKPCPASKCPKCSSTCDVQAPILFGNGRSWATHSIDTQEVAGDTNDLEQYKLSQPLIMDFRSYGINIQEFKLHIGLKQKIQPYGSPQPLSSTTDDYNAKIMQYLRTQPNLKKLHLILEICADDDKYEYKPYYTSSPSSNVKVQAQGSSSVNIIVTPDLKSIVNSSTPTGLTFIHVEMPGLSPTSLPEWKYFLDLQTSLKTLICNFGVVLWTFYSDAILNNSGTLDKVSLRRVTSFNPEIKKHEPFDWAIFGNCKNLKYLKVTCGFRERWSEWQRYERPPNPNEDFNYVNFDKLPKGLKELHYARFKIDRNTLAGVFGPPGRGSKICKNCPDREYYDGDWDDFSKGLSFEMEDWQVEFGERAKTQHHKRRGKNRDLWMSLICIIFCISCVMMIAGFYIAIFYSYPKLPHAHGRRTQ